MVERMSQLNWVAVLDEQGLMVEQLKVKSLL